MGDSDTDRIAPPAKLGAHLDAHPWWRADLCRTHRRRWDAGDDLHPTPHPAESGSAPSGDRVQRSRSLLCSGRRRGIWWLVYFSRAGSDDTAGLSPIAFQTGQALGKPGRFAHVPTPIIIIGCLYLLSTCICALLALLPFPAFMMGFIVAGVGAHILYLSIAVFTGAIGHGLLKLANWARIATLAMLGIGFFNAGLALLPWYETRFRIYNQQVTESMHLPAPAVPMPELTHFYAIFGIVTIVLFNGAILWFLQRHKRAFFAPPPPAVAQESY